MIAIPPHHRSSRRPPKPTAPNATQLAFSVSSISEAFLPLVEAFHQIGDSITEVALDAYLARHDRLPGSNRTARLRKKRNSRVMQWFLDEFLPM